MNKFKELGLSVETTEVLTKMGFTNPTPVQEKAIPHLLSNKTPDFIGLAQTGTGKTAAFGLPLLELVNSNQREPQALILAPTRELAQQTAKQLTAFSAGNKSLNIVVVYGGAPISNQIKLLRQPAQIIVATPGRLIDLIDRKSIKLGGVKYVVLDEADEMLNMGFKEDIDRILSYTPEEKVTWLFSATMPAEIRKIVKKYMTSPVEVSINSGELINKDIEHQYVVTTSSNKVAAVRRFLDIQPDMRGIMFCRTRRETKNIADDLNNLNYGVEALHGDLSQSQRDAVMRRFKMRSMQLLIATDVAARGIDVNDLTHVFHHTLPDQLDIYTHRSGRTARAGKKGISIAFINPREGKRVTELEKKMQVKFKRVEVPGVEEMRYSRINSWANLIINTKVDDKAENILEHLHGQFAHLSKDDILRRLITTQLDHLVFQHNEDGDLNEKTSFESGKSSRKGSSGSNRYFVNVGIIDGMTKGDLIHFLSDVSRVDRKYFGDVSMHKNYSFFEVDEKKDAKLAENFMGVEIEGRQIRVNLDEQKKRNAPVKRKGKSKGNRKSRRSNKWA